MAILPVSVGGFNTQSKTKINNNIATKGISYSNVQKKDTISFGSIQENAFKNLFENLKIIKPIFAELETIADNLRKNFLSWINKDGKFSIKQTGIKIVINKENGLIEIIKKFNEFITLTYKNILSQGKETKVFKIEYLNENNKLNTLKFQGQI